MALFFGFGILENLLAKEVGQRSHMGPTGLLGAPLAVARGLVTSPGVLSLGSQVPRVSSVLEKIFSEVLFRLDSV